MEIQSPAGGGRLQEPCGARERVRVLYGEQVLDHLSLPMRGFLARQGMVFIATADSRGECDCSFWTGSPEFAGALDNETLAYAEYKGTGVSNSLRNISENPHIGMLFVDPFESAAVFHIRGRARIVVNGAIVNRPDLPERVRRDNAGEGGCRPERWVMVDVEEAHLRHSRRMPLREKPDNDLRGKESS